jgi:dimethylargininase
MFTRALTRAPSSSLASGLTTAKFGQPDPARARAQHRAYASALEASGLQVDVLPALDEYPDSVFIEDVAVCTPTCAVVTRPGADSRRGEAALVEPWLREHFDCIESLAGGTLDGGDVLAVGTHYFIGLSRRTNRTGARELIEILARHGLTGSTVAFDGALHLKTGATYLEGGRLLVLDALARLPAFRDFERLVVAPDEAYAANALWINDRVLLPAGHPRTRNLIERTGYDVVEVEMSEFRKLDGGVTCLSLRF